MKILEKFIKGKKADASLCEDEIYISESFIAVVDGATSKSSRLFNGKAGGKAAADTIIKTLESVSAHITCFDAVRIITEKIAELYEPTEEKGSAAASAIIYSNHRKELWCVGDCQCIINGKKHLHEKEIDRILSKQRALVIENEIKNGATVQELLLNDTGRQAILPQLKIQHRLANHIGELGYGVFNGTPVPEEYIKIYKLNDNDTVILASDGYPILCDTLEESETLLAKEIAENPLCYIGYKTTKGISPQCSSFDDRAYIKFIV